MHVRMHNGTSFPHYSYAGGGSNELSRKEWVDYCVWRRFFLEIYFVNYFFVFVFVFFGLLWAVLNNYLISLSSNGANLSVYVRLIQKLTYEEMTLYIRSLSYYYFVFVFISFSIIFSYKAVCFAALHGCERDFWWIAWANITLFLTSRFSRWCV